MKYQLLLCLLLPAGATLAQAPAPAGPRKLTIYLAADGTQLPTAEGADHRADLSLRDSVSGFMREYYPSGKLWKVIPYAHVGRGIRHGVALTYDEAGTLRRREEFVAGRRQGEVQVFDAQGALSRLLTYEQGQRTSQQCFTPSGQPKGCKAEQVLPQTKGGIPALVAAIQAGTVISGEEQARFPHGGPVLLRFVVGPDTRITGAVVKEAPSPAIGQAVLEAFNRVASFTAAGTVDGEPVPVAYDLPVRIHTREDPWAAVHDTKEREYNLKITFLGDDN